MDKTFYRDVYMDDIYILVKGFDYSHSGSAGNAIDTWVAQRPSCGPAETMITVMSISHMPKHVWVIPFAETCVGS